MQALKEAGDCILKAKDIAISGHINPDGDSLGSILSLGLGLERLGKSVFMLCQDRLPIIYRTLPGADRIVKTIKKRVDLAIAVDCSTKELLGRNIKVFDRAKSILEIDNHEFRRPFGDIRFIDYKAGAVGELIYLLLRELKVEITKDIAENLSVSIIVETNSFKLAKVRPFIFKLCGELLRKGIDFSKLVDTIYGSRRKESMVLSGLCLARCKFLKRGKVVWSVVRQKDFSKLKAEDYDIDAVANEMRSIRGVEIAVLFREENKRLMRVSLRSKGEINIASIAEKYNGGGHFDSAGCYIPNNVKSMREILSLAENLLRLNVDKRGSYKNH